jgi:5-methylthioadenosine/S-adenosylhomocysteine deaminase
VSPPPAAADLADDAPAGPAWDLLLTGGTVLTLDDERRVIEHGAVAIAGDRIAAVGAADELITRRRAARVVDCTGKLVLPGLIDTHNHLFQTLARGLGEGLTGWRWLAEFMWPYAGAITAHETEVAAQLGAIEAARAGTTALLDHHYGCADVETTLAVAGAIEAVGLRGVVARGIAGPLTDLGRRQGLPESSFPYSAEQELEYTRACMEARPAGSKVAVWPGPINITYTDRELLRASVELARERGTGWHTHFLAPQPDPQIYRDAYGVRPATWLHDEGLLGPDATLAHATWVDDGDVALLGGTHSCVAHCPASNMIVPFGVMPLRALRTAGATVGLGTDGSACGHRQDLFEQMKLMVLLHRTANLDPEATDVAEALELATREGARVLQLDAGRLAGGALADVAVVDLDAPHLRPVNDPLATAVYAAHGDDVWMTVVGGEVVFEDGCCTHVDEAAVIAEAQACTDALVRRAGLEDLRTRSQSRTRSAR